MYKLCYIGDDDACVVQSGLTALMVAVWKCHLSEARFLMEQFVAINMSDKVRTGEDIYAMLYCW